MKKQESLGQFVSLHIKGDLFSEYYIENKLSKDRSFKDLTQNSSKVLNKILAIYNEKRPLLKKNMVDESTLEEEFIKPILSELGHIWDVQCPVLSHKGIEKQPDYALFPSVQMKTEALQEKDSDTYFKLSIGLLEAKEWDLDLDKGYKETPSLQIKRYLRLSQVKWGILTNGKIWRLYNKESSFSSNVYLEINLEEILKFNNDLFKYFYTFFSFKAFYRVNGLSFLDHINEQSIQFASEVKKELDENVYKALKTLTQGFLNYTPNKLSKEDLSTIHDNCLILLYRLLFLFYAESKNLLNYSKHSERYSIHKISKEISAEIKKKATYAPLENGLWQRLKKAFNLIDKGSEDILGEKGIPAYNGGLFDGRKNSFLANYEIGNTYLVKAIDFLARRKNGDIFSRVDYATLKIKHLGAIYEKLLEYKLKIAEVNLGIKKGEYYEENDPDKIIVQKGDVYLLTDKGERKATGSYYTPDYIVQYIVENTIGKVIETRTKAARKNGKSEAIEILKLRILDPAMGSGHFLVDSVEYMAEELLRAINRDLDKGLWNVLSENIDEALKKVNEDNGEEDNTFDIEEAKRKIVQNCIYGVDINPLATELAKLSLWLTTISKGKPLSFLDHHLKVGNSLIGADIYNLNYHPNEVIKEGEKKQSMLDFLGDKTDIEKIIQGIKKMYQNIAKNPEEKPEDIYEKENLYSIVKKNKIFHRLNVLSDIHTSYYFGNKFSIDQYQKLKNAINDDARWELLIQKDWVKKITHNTSENNELEKDILKKEKIFHWQLEFPEIFFRLETDQEEEEIGFDVVIGNPPYVSNWQLTHSSPHLVKILEKLYPNVTTGHWDLFVPFVKKSIILLKNQGMHSFILPTSFSMEKYGWKIREDILKNHKLENLTEFGTFKAFGQKIDRLFLTYTVKKNADSSNTEIWYYDLKQGFKKKGDLEQLTFKKLPNYTLRSNVTKKDFSIKEKLENQSIKLGNLCCINVGVVAHSASNSPKKFTKDDVIHKEKKEGYKKYLNGTNVIRHLIDWDGKYFDYESKKEYFHRPKFNELFDSEKILISRTSSEGGRIPACLDYDSYYSNDSVIIATKWSERILEHQKPKNEWKVSDSKDSYSMQYIAGLINSSLLSYYFTNFYATDTLQGTYSSIYPEDVRNLPIRRIEKDNKQKEEIIVKKVRLIMNKKSQASKINLNIEDYLGKYTFGKKLGDLYTPIKGLSESIFIETTADKENLRIARIAFEEDNGLILKLSARFKPVNKQEFDDLDYWGYKETDFIPVMKFSVDGKMKVLIREFTKLAVDKANGFANFRKNATKRTSLIDRLEQLTLPKLEDVESGLRKYIEQKERSEELKEEIYNIDILIDAIVFKLYKLDDDEVKVILLSLDIKEKIREDIIEKFRGIE